MRVRRDAGSAPVGAGVLCTDRHILTCAHVVDPPWVRDPAEPEVLGVIAADGPVNALAWHRFGDEEVLVVGTATGAVRLYGGPEMLLGAVEDLGSPVTALTTVPEQIIAIGTAGGGLWLLFQASEPILYQLSLGTEVSALAWSSWPDGWPVLAIGLADGSVSLWDPRHTVAEDGTWHVDDPATIRAMAPATAMPVPVTTLSWGPDGPPTLFGGGAADGVVRTWDVTGDAETHAFNADRNADSVLATGVLNGRAVLASAGSRLRIWDRHAGRRRRRAGPEHRRAGVRASRQGSPRRPWLSEP